MEVILSNCNRFIYRISILHVCGGDPKMPFIRSCTLKYSPRMWRWSCGLPLWNVAETVFSTYVEVILFPSWLDPAITSILHVCGGDPKLPWFFLSRAPYSPRMWRWSCQRHLSTNPFLVFSTYVEVILRINVVLPESSCILHVCGGDPRESSTDTWMNMYSPRMWRWS